MKSTLYIITVIVIALLAGFAGFKIRKPETIIIDRTKPAEVDTVYSVIEKPIHIYHTVTKLDTIFERVVLHDTIVVDYATPVAFLADTTLVGDSGTEYGTLSVAYYFPPYSAFDINFRPAPLPTITVTKYVEPARRKTPWYEKLLYIGGGALAGYGAAKL